MLALPLLLALTWLALAVAARKEVRGMPRLTGTLPASSTTPRVLCVIPARNESEVVERALRGVLAQQGVDLRVILYDDRSTDDTAALAEMLVPASGGRLTVVRGQQEPPPGWCGKPHALERALSTAGYDARAGKSTDGTTPDVIAFVDADVILQPTALAELAALMRERHAGLASALPHLECVTFWERVGGPSVSALITARHKPSHVNDVDKPAVLANGQLLMVTPEAYARAGGHEAVRSQVLEDVLLARRVKQLRIPILLVDGQAVMSTRMYSSLHELWQGWSKNAYPLVGGTPGRALGYAALVIALSWTPAAALVTSLLLALQRAWLDAAVWSVGYLIPLSMQMLLRRTGGVRARDAVFAPLGALLVALLLIRATVVAVRKAPVTWKGRSYVDGVGTGGDA
ncbi:MAG: glycosyltransferase family 2 protein [Myxococcota bacterium]